MVRMRNDGEQARGGAAVASAQDPTRDNQEHELEAEQESAEAMDAEATHAGAPQPPGADETTEGQPS